MKIPDWYPSPDLPDGAVPMASLLVVSYLDSTGERRYVVHAKGDSPMLTYLGMTVVAQQEIAHWSD